MTHSFADALSESSFLAVTMQSYKDRWTFLYVLLSLRWTSMPTLSLIWGTKKQHWVGLQASLLSQFLMHTKKKQVIWCLADLNYQESCRESFKQLRILVAFFLYIQETVLHSVITKQLRHQDTQRHNTRHASPLCYAISLTWYFLKEALVSKCLVLESSARTIETPRTSTFQETTDTVAVRSHILLWTCIPPKINKTNSLYVILPQSYTPLTYFPFLYFLFALTQVLFSMNM